MNQADMADLNIAFTMLVDKLLAYNDNNSKFNQTVSNLPAILENFSDRMQRLENKFDHLSTGTEKFIENLTFTVSVS